MRVLGNILCVLKPQGKGQRSSADPAGGTGGPDPPGKSQVIWVSIGNKQLDPPPLEKVGRPPPPWKMFDPLYNLEKMIVFFEINHLTFVK